MSISFFGLFILVYTVWLMFFSKEFREFYISFLALALIVTTNVNMGYFLKIGDSSFSYDSFFMYALIPLSMMMLHGKMMKLDFVALISLAGILVLNYAMFFIAPFKGQVVVGDWSGYVLGENVSSYLHSGLIAIGYYLVFISVFITTITMSRKLDYDSLKSVLCKVVNVSKSSIVLGYIEFITKNVFHSKAVINFCIAIFGIEGAHQNYLTYRSSLYTLQGATKEASMFTKVLFYIIILLAIQSAVDDSKRKNNLKWILCAMVLLLVNPALSSYVYIVIVAFIFLTSGIAKRRMNLHKMFRKSILIIGISAAGFFLVMGYLLENYQNLLSSDNYLLNRIGLAIQQLKVIISGVGSLVYSSEALRFSGIIYDFEMWMKRPLLGFGSGTLACVSGLMTFLVQFGALGVFAYFFCLVYYGKQASRKIGMVLLLCVEIWVLPNLFLNDMKTIMMLIVPFDLIMYGYNIAAQSKLQRI